MRLWGFWTRIDADERGSFLVRGSLSRPSWGSPALVVARFLAACWLGGWRRRVMRGEAPAGGLAKRHPWRRTPACSGPPALRFGPPPHDAPSHRRSLGPPGRVCCAAATSAGDGPGRWRAGPSAAAPAKVRGGGVGGRRPGFGDMDVAEKPPWTGSRRPGRGPPTPPPPRQPPATAEGPARHLRRDSHPQRRHNTATPKTPAHPPRESSDPKGGSALQPPVDRRGGLVDGVDAGVETARERILERDDLPGADQRDAVADEAPRRQILADRARGTAEIPRLRDARLVETETRTDLLRYQIAARPQRHRRRAELLGFRTLGTAQRPAEDQPAQRLAGVHGRIGLDAQLRLPRRAGDPHLHLDLVEIPTRADVQARIVHRRIGETQARPLDAQRL